MTNIAAELDRVTDYWTPRHNPVADDEVGIVLIETKTTLHTGDVTTERSVPIERQLR